MIFIFGGIIEGWVVVNVIEEVGKFYYYLIKGDE